MHGIYKIYTYGYCSFSFAEHSQCIPAGIFEVHAGTLCPEVRPLVCRIPWAVTENNTLIFADTHVFHIHLNCPLFNQPNVSMHIYIYIYVVFGK